MVRETITGDDQLLQKFAPQAVAHDPDTAIGHHGVEEFVVKTAEFRDVSELIEADVFRFRPGISRRALTRVMSELQGSVISGSRSPSADPNAVRSPVRANKQVVTVFSDSVAER